MKTNNRKLNTPQSLNAYTKSICDIMRRSGRAGALQYVPELTWMLFLRILDEKEQREEEQAKAVDAGFRHLWNILIAGGTGQIPVEGSVRNCERERWVDL